MSSKKVVAIIATDYAGNPCNWKELRHIASKYNIKLINDNCHAIGASYYNDKSYAVKYADIVTHSYHPVKNITTCEGGMTTTNNKQYYYRMKSFLTHGITRDYKDREKSASHYYEMVELGYNYRITDVFCALGINQLTKLDHFIKRRQDLVFL